MFNGIGLEKEEEIHIYNLIENNMYILKMHIKV
jgi:hypothetical protein